MFKKSAILLVFIASGLVFFSQMAGAQAIPNLFVPADYSPLSPFKSRIATDNQRLEFSLKSEIINYIKNNNLTAQVVYQNDAGAVNFISLPYANMDAVLGKAWLNTTLTGNFTVVADGFKNDFPIVTHWDQTLNSGRGGFKLGGTDELGIFDIDLTTGEFKDISYIYDENPNSIYTYDTDKYALFSHDPLNPNAKVPGPERYIGEDYSIYGIPKNTAGFLGAATVLEMTGYPLIHRNYPSAFNTSLPIDKQARENFPAFQIVHNVLIAPTPDKASLASFVLPPNWVKNPSTPYPILLATSYDNNENTVFRNGPLALRVMSALQLMNYGPSMTIFWNGGCTWGCTVLQPSVYDNAKLLFAQAKLLGGDPHKVVATGVSKGGVGTLAVAGNPFDTANTYTVKEAIAYAFASRLGEIVYNADGFNVGNNEGHLALYVYLGYKYSWQSGWKDPVTGLSPLISLLNTFIGTTDRTSADNVFSPYADSHIQTLKRKGTKLFLSLGTNDVVGTAANFPYYDKLAAAGVPTELEIGYRSGHFGATRVETRTLEAMQRVMSGEQKTRFGVHHWRRINEQDIATHEEFFPTNQPVYLEAPLLTAAGIANKVNIVGGPGTNYRFEAWKIDDVRFFQTQEISEVSKVAEISGTFSGTKPIQVKTETFTIASLPEPGFFYYKLFYQFPGGAWQQIPGNKLPHPYVFNQPVFLATPTDEWRLVDGGFSWRGNGPLLTGLQLSVILLVELKKAWGLSSE